MEDVVPQRYRVGQIKPIGEQRRSGFNKKQLYIFAVPEARCQAYMVAQQFDSDDRGSRGQIRPDVYIYFASWVEWA